MKRNPGKAAMAAGAGIHPAIPDLAALARRGETDRRAFLRTATLLGLSASAAYTLAGIAPTGSRAAPGAAGGTLRISMKVQEMTDPARFDWTEKSNVARHIVEYLTITGTDNVTRPYLARAWSASEDLRTWTFKLRRRIRWSNGDSFDAEDVAYNFRRWVDPKTGSSNKSLFSGLSAGGVEVVDRDTVRLHLSKPELAIPENLYNYPAAIVHRRFAEEGGDLSKNPVGTGPYRLDSFAIGEKAVLVRRKKSAYWGPRPALERIIYIDHGDDPMAGIAAIASGQADLNYEISPDQLELVQSMPQLQLFEAATAQTAVARMRVDRPPFDNAKLRRAVQACIDHGRLLELGYRGKGAAGEDHHVAPVHPDYAALPKQRQDYALARKLLADAGHPNGVKLSIDCRSAPSWEPTTVQAMSAMCRPAGIDLKINTMPSEQYGDIWNKTPFGFTGWTHRPLGVMVLNLAYRSGAAWNESGYANRDFDLALNRANATLDIPERRRYVAACERILQRDAVIVQPLWRSIFAVGSKRLRGYRLHPTNYHQLGGVGLG